MSCPTDRRPRWPRSVYSTGEEPDYRFSFANERTFLAWIRTGLALLAAGVAVDVVDLDMPGAVQAGIGLALVVLGAVAACTAWFRWSMSERAIRRREPLPSMGLALALVAGLVLVSAVVAFIGF